MFLISREFREGLCEEGLPEFCLRLVWQVFPNNVRETAGGKWLV
jgi:hypothetical protein